MRTGTILPNGAAVVEVIAQSPDRMWVLAHRDEAYQQWVTWAVDRDGNCYWGHYLDTQTEARADLIARAYAYGDLAEALAMKDGVTRGTLGLEDRP